MKTGNGYADSVQSLSVLVQIIFPIAQTPAIRSSRSRIRMSASLPAVRLPFRSSTGQPDPLHGIGNQAEIPRAFAFQRQVNQTGVQVEAIDDHFGGQHRLQRENALFPVPDTWLFSVSLDERAHPEKGEVP